MKTWRDYFAEKTRYVRASNRYITKSAVEEEILYDTLSKMVEACRDEVYVATAHLPEAQRYAAVRKVTLQGVMSDPEKLHCVEAFAATVPHTDPGVGPRDYAPEAA